MDRKLIYLVWVAISFCQPRLNAEENIRNKIYELQAPLCSSASLKISLPPGVKTQGEAMSDYSEYRFSIPEAHSEDFLAVMTIYVGQNPARLVELVRGRKFYEEIAHFQEGRTTWFSWIGENGKDKTYFSAAYLYNTYKEQPNNESPYVVQITIQGNDFAAIKSLKTAAQSIKRKN